MADYKETHYKDKYKRLLYYTIEKGNKIEIRNKNGKIIGSLKNGKTYDSTGKLVLSSESPGFVYELTNKKRK